MRHDSMRTARRSMPRSRHFQRTSSFCCCAASRSRPIRRIAGRAAPPRRCPTTSRRSRSSPGHCRRAPLPDARVRKHRSRCTGTAARRDVCESRGRRSRTRDICTGTACAAPGACSKRSPNSKRPTGCTASTRSAEKVPLECGLACRAQPRPARRRRCQYAGQVKRAETLLKSAFALPTNLLVQAYNKREWPMFLRARGRYAEAEAAAQDADGGSESGDSGHGPHRGRLRDAGAERDGPTPPAPSNAALRLLRTAPGGGIAANALLALQGEFNLRTADRTKGRDDARGSRSSNARRARARCLGQALFTIEAIARAARTVGDWELAGQMAKQMIDHDPSYAGSHYARGLAAEHDDDAGTAKAEFALAAKLLGEGRSGPAGAGGSKEEDEMNTQSVASCQFKGAGSIRGALSLTCRCVDAGIRSCRLQPGRRANAADGLPSRPPELDGPGGCDRLVSARRFR